jgi:nitrate/nitrite transporter NarK
MSPEVETLLVAWTSICAGWSIVLLIVTILIWRVTASFEQDRRNSARQQRWHERQIARATQERLADQLEKRVSGLSGAVSHASIR